MLSELSLKKENHKDIIRRLPIFSTKKKEGVERVERQEKLPAPDKGGEQFLLPSGEPKSAQSYTITGGNSGEEDGSFTNGTGAQRSATFTGGESSRGFTGETSVLHPHPSTTKESAMPSVRKIKIEFVAKEELAQKIERAKQILRHKFPEGRFEDIFNQALEDMLEKRDPQRKIERLNKKSEKISKDGEKPSLSHSIVHGKRKPMTRYIPEQVRRIVFERDHGQCSYESPDGKRCGERNFIQIDHAQPFALSGESTEENLRLLCSQHNQWRAEKTFGKWG